MSLYGYEQRLARCQRSIKQLRNGETALRFLTHLGALGLSIGRVTKYAAHLPVLLRAIDFDLKDVRREDAERVVVYINSQPHRETTKRDKKLLLRKLVQFAKNGTCDRDTPLPDEVKWIKLRVKENDPRATPESLLTPREFAAIVKAASNNPNAASCKFNVRLTLIPKSTKKAATPSASPLAAASRATQTASPTRLPVTNFATSTFQASGFINVTKPHQLSPLF